MLVRDGLLGPDNAEVRDAVVVQTVDTFIYGIIR
jgi:hypothetical protein